MRNTEFHIQGIQKKRVIVVKCPAGIIWTHLWVKLLLRAGVTILAAISTVTLGGLAPLVSVFHVGTGGGPGGGRAGGGGNRLQRIVNDNTTITTIKGVFNI